MNRHPNKKPFTLSGRWPYRLRSLLTLYQAKAGAARVTVLYLHGGGYAYYSAAHQNLIALVTLAARARTFALDYRLIPEHPFPAQLEDALAAYRWLLQTGVAPERLVVAGDSAGGNLTLALLLALREAGLPLPALGVCLAPWVDVLNSGASMTANAPYDWVEKRMADRAEILHDMIRAFADRAAQQGADVELEVWPDMPHDFQAFGEVVPESKAALDRIRQVIEETLSLTV